MLQFDLGCELPLEPLDEGILPDPNPEFGRPPDPPEDDPLLPGLGRGRGPDVDVEIDVDVLITVFFSFLILTDLLITVFFSFSTVMLVDFLTTVSSLTTLVTEVEMLTFGLLLRTHLHDEA